MLVGWMYVSLDPVGESIAKRFEGDVQDVPIAQISRVPEIELRDLLSDRSAAAVAADEPDRSLGPRGTDAMALGLVADATRPARWISR
jgi:predicted membrane chloride channel (bestrophin family)